MRTASLSRLALLCAASAALALASPSCAGRSARPESGSPPDSGQPLPGPQHPSAPAADVPPLGGLPGLPGAQADGPPRGASYQSLYFAWGNAIFGSSDNAIFAGNSVTLLSDMSSIGWSTYPFSTGDFQPVNVYVDFSAPASAPVYVGISDYDRGAWRFYGPYASSTSISLPAGNYQNITGQCFVAVVVFGGSSATVNHLYVLTDNGQPGGQTISGIVKDENDKPLAGIKLTCDAPGFPIVYTDSAGGYEFNAIPDGSYTVEPDSFDTFTSSFAFTPPSQSLNLSGSGQTGVNFTAERHDITGRVKLSGGTGVAGVLMTLMPGGSTVTTDGSGRYLFAAVADNDYTVTPLLASYSFNPDPVNVSVAGADAQAADIVATGGAPTFSLSGHVQDDSSVAMAGVAVTIVPTYQLVFTDASGNYQFDDLSPADYTLTAAKGVYEFTPVSRNVTIDNADVTGADFTGALPILWTIGGTVKTPGGNPLGDLMLKVQISNPSSTFFIYSDDGGAYTVEVPDGSNVTVTPQLFGMAFSPANRIYAGIGTDSTSDDYTGSYQPSPTYENFVQYYMGDWCLSCHSPTADNSVNPMLTTYMQVTNSAGACNGRIQADTMPPGGGNPASGQEFFQAWIDAGMPES